MSREDLIRFATRDWATIAHAKEQQWLREKRAGGGDLCRRIDDLLRHARSNTHAWRPSATDRLADWQVHQRVGQALRAVTRTTR